MHRLGTYPYAAESRGLAGLATRADANALH